MLKGLDIINEVGQIIQVSSLHKISHRNSLELENRYRLKKVFFFFLLVKLENSLDNSFQCQYTALVK